MTWPKEMSISQYVSVRLIVKAKAHGAIARDKVKEVITKDETCSSDTWYHVTEPSSQTKTSIGEDGVMAQQELRQKVNEM